VLVVDDEMNLRRLASTVIEQYGCVATEAASAEEALDRLRETRYDVVVSDLGMGAGMNGWELAMEVRHLWPGTRFVLATGWGADIDPETARAGGVDAVVSKPYRPAELTRLLTAD